MSNEENKPEGCSGSCESCGESCGSRTNPQSMKVTPGANTHDGRNTDQVCKYDTDYTKMSEKNKGGFIAW